MFKILSLIFAGLALTSGNAGAADRNLIRGTYCSAATTDGKWAFTWSINTVFYNCALVRDALAARTLAPIQRWQRGYYAENGFNQVGVSCYGGNAFFTNFGALALQNAYNYASFNNGLGCIFVVN